jgi:pimeloyl-ACP methyl ester carboxylesterase
LANATKTTAIGGEIFLRRGVRSSDGTNVEWTEYGTGFPVLVSAPAAIPLWYWEPVVRALGERFRIIFVHPRGLGHGSLPKDLRAVTVADHARDLLCVVQELGLEDYAVVGHCVGAAPVVKSLPLMSRRPRLVLVVSARLEAGAATQNFEKVVERVRADPRFRGQYAQVAAAYAHTAFRRELEVRLQCADELEAHLWAIHDVRLYSYSDTWPVDVGAVFVTSAGDLESIRTSTATYASKLGARHHQLEGGHFALLERPELGLRLIRDALQD